MHLLSHQQIQQQTAELFVHSMPFNQLLGLKLHSLTDTEATLCFSQHPSLIGNAAQQILHGGVIASVLDVTAGLICASSVLIRQNNLTKEQLEHRLSHIGTVDLRIDYLRPGRGESFIATAKLERAGNKVAVAHARLHNQNQDYLACATAVYLVG